MSLATVLFSFLPDQERVIHHNIFAMKLLVLYIGKYLKARKTTGQRAKF